MIPHNVNFGPLKMRSLAAAALLAASGAASAVPVDKTMYFQCTYPLIGQQPLTANIHTDMPESIQVGDATGAFTLEITATAEGNTYQGLSLVGATTLEGTAKANSTVSGNSLNLPLTVPLTIPVTDISGVTGPFDLTATGDTPSLTFTQDNVGTVDIFVDETMSLSMIARKADGTAVDFGSSWHDPNNPEAFLVDCTMDQARMDQNGVDNKLHSFEVTGATAEQNIKADPEEVDFGMVQGGLTKDMSVTISNTGGQPLGVNGVSLGGADAASFMQTNDCTTVAAGDSCTVTVTFMPTGEGERNGTLTIASDDPDTPSLDVPLTGQSQLAPEPNITADPQSANFGSVTVGSSKDMDVTIGNDGTASLNITGVSVGGANASEFIQSNDCTNVAAGDSCTVSITFTPAGQGDKSATLTVQSNDPDTASLTVALSGKGTEQTGGGVEVDYGLDGSTKIKKANGTVSLSGAIHAVLDLATGMFTADLNLDPTSGSFKILRGWSFIQADAKIGFEQVGQTEGTLNSENVLSADAKMYIKMPKVKLKMFGFGFPVGGGDQCKTAEPVNIHLDSPAGETFDPLGAGGNLEGVYDLPGLSNCGALTDILNLFMAGGGNTIQLSLTPDLQ